MNKAIHDDTLVASLRDAIAEGTAGLSGVPGLLKRLLEEQAWKVRVNRHSGHVTEFQRFEEFVKAAPLEGLGTELKTLQRLCADEPAVLNLLDQEIQGKRGRPSRKNLHIMQDNGQPAPTGTRQQTALRRLRKDRPDLLARVAAKELTANAAMVEAGFWPKTITVTLRPRSAARTILKNFTPDQVRELIEELKRSGS